MSINALLGRAAGVTAPWAAWFFAWPLAKLVALLPVSLAGLGVRDMALVFFLEPLGGTRKTVAAAALAWSSIIVAAGLLGGMFLAMPQLNGSRGISRAKRMTRKANLPSSCWEPGRPASVWHGVWPARQFGVTVVERQQAVGGNSGSSTGRPAASTSAATVFIRLATRRSSPTS